MVVNHYTDLRDIDGAVWPDVPVAEPVRGTSDKPIGDVDGGCSTIWARTDQGLVLSPRPGDMHGTAIPYILMLKVPETAEVPETWLFSITGCVGMAGLNRHGVSAAINNLRSSDARVGVLWPALIRKTLQQTTAQQARAVIERAPIGSGHHYLVADRQVAYGIETSGRQCKRIFTSALEPTNSEVYLHTNHCLDADIEAVSSVPATSNHLRASRLAAAQRIRASAHRRT